MAGSTHTRESVAKRPFSYKEASIDTYGRVGMIRIIIFSNDRETREKLSSELSGLGYAIMYANDEDEFLAAVAAGQVTAAVTTALVDAADPNGTLRVDELTINPNNYEVSLHGEPLELTYKEYELLKLLAMHQGRVFSRETLLNQIWGYDYFGGTRTVDVHIRRLRAKLGIKYGSLIQTVRNVGYRFKKDGA